MNGTGQEQVCTAKHVAPTHLSKEKNMGGTGKHEWAGRLGRAIGLHKASATRISSYFHVARVVLVLILLVGLVAPAPAGGKSRVVVISPTPGGVDIPIGPDEKVGAVTVLDLPGGGQVAVVRIDPMPAKADFNIITPDGVSHPFTNGPTGVPGETVRWVSQPIHHPDGSTSYEVYGEVTGPGYSGRTVTQKFPPGSVCQPDPPQPPGLVMSCPDALPTDASVEAFVLASLGMPNNPEIEVWSVPSCEFWFWHPASPDWEMVWIGSEQRHSAARRVAGPLLPQDIEIPGWFENFDSYPTGSGLHGQGDWKGWDNDLIFDALVTNEEAISPPNSVAVAADADVVNEEIGEPTAGRWQFATWQYIPGDFESGSQTPDAPGTYFLMLNNYEDGGEKHWSVSYNFDSNDGMLKVNYGNGLNTVNVPYVPDLWVELKVVIDLNTDWTEVYYDDQFLAGYSWTGGIYGDGLGLPQIDAVQLYANGSTPVYYDNLSLRPLP